MREKLKDIGNRFVSWFSVPYNMVRRYSTGLACLVTALFFAISFLITPTRETVERDASKLERKIQQRLALLDGYVGRAFENP